MWDTIVTAIPCTDCMLLRTCTLMWATYTPFLYGWGIILLTKSQKNKKLDLM